MQCGSQFIFGAKSYRSPSKFPRPFGQKGVSWPIASLSLKNNYVQKKTALYYFVASFERLICITTLPVLHPPRLNQRLKAFFPL